MFSTQNKTSYQGDPVKMFHSLKRHRNLQTEYPSLQASFSFFLEAPGFFFYFSILKYISLLILRGFSLKKKKLTNKMTKPQLLTSAINKNKFGIILFSGTLKSLHKTGFNQALPFYQNSNFQPRGQTAKLPALNASLSRFLQ